MKIFYTILLVGLITNTGNSQVTVFNFKSENPVISTGMLNGSSEILTQYLKTIKPTYTDYVVLPNGKSNSTFEFHDHEVTTLNGNTVGLSTINLSGVVLSNLPSSYNNGASITHQSVYREDLFGSGNIPWVTMLASSGTEGPSITLNAVGNLYPDNKKASFIINNGTENVFSMATTAEGGSIGWKQPESMRLILSADKVYTTGQLFAAGSIHTNQYLVTGDNASNIKISSIGINFSNSDNSNYIGALKNSYGSWDKQYGTFIIQAVNNDMVLNSVSTNSSKMGSISFAFDFKNTASFTSTAIFFGRPFTRQSLHDEDIFAIQNPSEGQEVYSLDQHTPVYFNGREWVQPFGFKKLGKVKTGTILN